MVDVAAEHSASIPPRWASDDRYRRRMGVHTTNGVEILRLGEKESVEFPPSQSAATVRVCSVSLRPITPFLPMAEAMPGRRRYSTPHLAWKLLGNPRAWVFAGGTVDRFDEC